MACVRLLMPNNRRYKSTWHSKHMCLGELKNNQLAISLSCTHIEPALQVSPCFQQLNVYLLFATRTTSFEPGAFSSGFTLNKEIMGPDGDSALKHFNKVQFNSGLLQSCFCDHCPILMSHVLLMDCSLWDF